MKKLVIAAIILISWTSSYSQINGKVYDSENSIPLEMVELIQNGKLITTTNINGRFTLAPSVFSDTITFRRLGYQTKHVFITDVDSLLMINMKTRNIELADVVVRE